MPRHISVNGVFLFGFLFFLFSLYIFVLLEMIKNIVPIYLKQILAIFLSSSNCDIALHVIDRM